jgi:hypothetical protein
MLHAVMTNANEAGSLSTAVMQYHIIVLTANSKQAGNQEDLLVKR